MKPSRRVITFPAITRSWAVPSALAGVALLIVGCGDGDDGDGGGNGGGITIEAFCERLHENLDETHCAELEAGPDAEWCDRVMEEGRQRCEVIMGAVASGRVGFDGRVAEACLEASSAEELVSYYVESLLPAGCTSPFEGLREGGSDCYRDYGFRVRECVEDHYCTRDACPGTCTPYGALDEACTFGTAPCGTGLVCYADCFECEGTCGPAPGEGESCEASWSVCAEGLVCNHWADPPTCIEPLPLGAPCELPLECESFICHDGQCASEDDICRSSEECDAADACMRNPSGSYLTCQPRLEAGEDCEENYEACQSGLQCLPKFEEDEILHECHTRAGIEGEPCLPWGCTYDHYCAWVDEEAVCKPRGDLGASCNDEAYLLPWSNPSCEEGLLCIYTEGECMPPGDIGEPCIHSYIGSCEDGLTCAPAWPPECQLPAALGEECNPVFPSACDDAYCDCVPGDGDDCEWTCIPLFENGAECFEDHACVSGYCGNDGCGTRPVEETPVLCIP
jgi:hypothetical protein